MNNPNIQFKATTPRRKDLRRGLFLIPLVLALAGLPLSPTARAVDPPPDGGYLNQNTAEGDGALFSLDTTTGLNNTAIGFNALYSLTTSSEDTVTGSLALANDIGGFNTAYGFSALYSNTTGFANTAIGRNAMLNHTSGDHNTATGGAALLDNTNGTGNTATGRAAMAEHTTGSENTATGWQALFNGTGHKNTADGAFALFSNTTGKGNIALGFQAGLNLTAGDNNIDIGNPGSAGDSNTIRIGKQATHTATVIAGISGTTVAGGVTVVVDTNGHLGTVTSSERFKDEIKPMDKASEAILALKPVSFRYKHELDSVGIPQFGLVAQQVAKVNPDLVARDAQGKVYTVRYEAINAMLLNEFLKEHRNVQKLETTVAQQQKEIQALTANLKEQASQIEKVSAQFQVSKPAPTLVVNDQ